MNRFVRNDTTSANESKEEHTMYRSDEQVNNVENVGRAYRPYRKSERGPVKSRVLMIGNVR